MTLRNLLLALAALTTLAGVAMLTVETPALGITALGGLMLAAALAERVVHRRRARLAAAAGPTATVEDAEIVEAYRFFFGREPESPEAIASKRGLGRRALVADMIGSEEYETRLIAPVLEGRAPSGGLFDAPPDAQTLAWAAGALPLDDATRRRLVQVPDWIDAHAAILGDPALRAAFPAIARRLPPDRTVALAVAAQGRSLIAEVEEATGRLVRGYAVDRASPDAAIVVELWIDGAFAASGAADQYRRDLEERFGAGGLHGFAFDDLAADLDGERPMRIEVRDAATKRVLGARRITLGPERDAQRLADIGEALRKARRDLDAMSDLLEQAVAAAGFTPATYDAYWRAYYGRTPADDVRDAQEMAAFAWRPRFDVLVVGDPLDRPAFAATEASVAAQGYPDHAVKRAPDGDPPDVESDYVLFVDAGDRLAPDALHRLAAKLQSADRPVWLTFDSDTVGEDGAHRDPVFRPAFDPDLLLQTPYLGSSAAARTDALRGVLDAGGSLAAEARGDLWLRLAEAVGAAHHIPRVLHHAAPGAAAASPERYANDVGAHLARIGSTAQVREGPDPNDPVSPAKPRLRIAWPLPAGATAAVIVPTRDRLDLLGPCLASLQASRAANRTTFEIVVVDNGSTDPATLQALDALSQGPGGRVIRHAEPFNWSAINNLAARAVEADVLIFLNNDTVVLSPDWCDALCAQALRPQIGAVGARLLYGDGSIQHAGIVLGTVQAIAAHESAGAPASDDGYLGRCGLTHRTAAVTGACVATRRELFLRLGGFDAVKLAIEANDVDYSLRVRHEGLAVLYEPGCTLYHFESRSRGHTGSDPGRRARADVSLAALERRWGAELRRDPYYNGHFDRLSRPFSRLGPPPEL